MTIDLAMKLNPRHTALIIVDVQNDFCHSDGVFGRRGGDMSTIQQAARRISPMVDLSHEVGVPTIFIRMINSDWTLDDATREQWRSLRPGGGPNVCWEGTWGTEFYHVAPSPVDRVVTKYRYSAFLYTELELVLRCKETKTLVVTGVMTNICVHATVRDGFIRGFHVVVPEDCCASSLPEDHQHTLKDMSGKLATIVSSATLREVWTGHGGE